MNYEIFFLNLNKITNYFIPTKYYYYNNEMYNITILIILIKLLSFNLIDKFISSRYIYEYKDSKIKFINKSISNVKIKKIIKNIKFYDGSKFINLDLIKNNINNIDECIPLSFLINFYYKIKINKIKKIEIDFYFDKKKQISSKSDILIKDII